MKIKLLLFLLLIPSFIALTKSGYFPMHDDIQGMRLLQMKKCILDFQIPCRWVPDMGYGYGYPQFNFYAPLPYYLMSLPVLVGVGILDSVKLGFLASIVLSGFSMYFLGSYLWGKNGGLISAIFYTYAPYRAVDIYVRGAMGEAWAFVFLPLIILFSLKKKVLPLALSFAGLLTTHLVTTIMFVPFYFAILLFLLKPKLNHYTKIVIGGIWGAGLGAYFILPALLEKKFVHIHTMLEGYFNYLAHFVGLKQLFFSTYWGYGVSNLGELDGISLGIGVFHWSMSVFVIFLLFMLKKYNELKKAVIFVAFAFFSVFLVHPKSQFIWDSISLMSYIQFPWRFLAVSLFFFSVALGASSKLFEKNKTRFVLILFLILVFLNGSFFKPQKYIDITDTEKFTGESWDKQQTISIFDYLPVYADLPPVSPAPDKPYILGANGYIKNGQKGTNWQTWNVVLKDEGMLRLQLFYFPGWEVKVNGKISQIDYSNELGLLTFPLSEGESFVHAKLKDTPLRKLSNLLTLISIMAIPVYYKILLRRQ